jgi:hypothetical protein
MLLKIAFVIVALLSVCWWARSPTARTAPIGLRLEYSEPLQHAQNLEHHPPYKKRHLSHDDHGLKAVDQYCSSSKDLRKCINFRRS